MHLGHRDSGNILAHDVTIKNSSGQYKTARKIIQREVPSHIKNAPLQSQAYQMGPGKITSIA